METHLFETKKFPVGDSLIHFFRKTIFNHIEGDFWIAGGAITSYLSGDKIKDFDLFFKTRKDACKVVIELRNKFEFKMHFCTDQAIKGHIKINGQKYNIDIVKNLFKEPIETIQKFDFTVCCLAVDKEAFYYHQSASFDILRRKLVVNDLPFPVSTTRRMTKYIKKGYSICNGTIMEILSATRNLPEEEFGLIDFYPID